MESSEASDTPSDQTSESEEEAAVLEVFADVDDPKLGISLHGHPPGAVTIADIVDGAWAHREGIRIGTVLLEVNGEHVNLMPEERFKTLLSKRPLHFVLRPPEAGARRFSGSSLRLDSDDQALSEEESWGVELTVSPEDKPLGISFVAFSPGSPKEITKVDVGSWAHETGLGTGDFVTMVNGHSVDDMEDSEFEALLENRPLQITVEPDILKEHTASEEDERLGLSFAGLPPGDVEVLEVALGTWSDRVGIAAGDIIVAVNNQELENMAADVFKDMMKVRPLTFLIEPVLAVTSAGSEESEWYGREVVAGPLHVRLGLRFEGLPPGHLRVLEVASGTWADTAGIRVGDFLCEVNGVDLTSMASEVFKAEIRERPLRLWVETDAPLQEQPVLNSGPQSGEVEHCQPDGPVGSPEPTLEGGSDNSRGSRETMDVVARLEDGRLGFSFETLPPGDVDIVQVESGCWAERMGIQAGDVLLVVNGHTLTDTTEEKFVEMMLERPLRLLVEPMDPSPLPVQPSDNWPAPPLAPPRQPMVAFRYGASAQLSVPPEFDSALGIHLTTDVADFGATSKVFIRSVGRGSWAAKNGLRAGDAITHIDGTSVKVMSVDALEDALDNRPCLLSVWARPVSRKPGQERENERVLSDDAAEERQAAARCKAATAGTSILKEQTEGAGLIGTNHPDDAENATPTPKTSSMPEDQSQKKQPALQEARYGHHHQHGHHAQDCSEHDAQARLRHQAASKLQAMHRGRAARKRIRNEQKHGVLACQPGVTEVLKVGEEATVDSLAACEPSLNGREEAEDVASQPETDPHMEETAAEHAHGMKLEHELESEEAGLANKIGQEQSSESNVQPAEAGLDHQQEEEESQLDRSYHEQSTVLNASDGSEHHDHHNEDELHEEELDMEDAAKGSGVPQKGEATAEQPDEEGGEGDVCDGDLQQKDEVEEVSDVDDGDLAQKDALDAVEVEVTCDGQDSQASQGGANGQSELEAEGVRVGCVRNEDQPKDEGGCGPDLADKTMENVQNEGVVSRVDKIDKTCGTHEANVLVLKLSDDDASEGQADENKHAGKACGTFEEDMLMNQNCLHGRCEKADAQEHTEHLMEERQLTVDHNKKDDRHGHAPHKSTDVRSKHPRTSLPTSTDVRQSISSEAAKQPNQAAVSTSQTRFSLKQTGEGAHGKAHGSVSKTVETAAPQTRRSQTKQAQQLQMSSTPHRRATTTAGRTQPVEPGARARAETRRATAPDAPCVPAKASILKHPGGSQKPPHVVSDKHKQPPSERRESVKEGASAADAPAAAQVHRRQSASAQQRNSESSEGCSRRPSVKLKVQSAIAEEPAKSPVLRESRRGSSDNRMAKEVSKGPLKSQTVSSEPPVQGGAEAGAGPLVMNPQEAKVVYVSDQKMVPPMRVPQDSGVKQVREELKAVQAMHRAALDAEQDLARALHVADMDASIRLGGAPTCLAELRFLVQAEETRYVQHLRARSAQQQLSAKLLSEKQAQEEALASLERGLRSVKKPQAFKASVMAGLQQLHRRKAERVLQERRTQRGKEVWQAKINRQKHLAHLCRRLRLEESLVASLRELADGTIGSRPASVVDSRLPEPAAQAKTATMQNMRRLQSRASQQAAQAQELLEKVGAMLLPKSTAVAGSAKL